MKKYFIPLIIASMTLVGCNAKNSSSEVKEFDRASLSIITPTGAPALAFYNYAGLSNFETNNDPQVIAKGMIAGQKDVVVLPTNAGIQPVKSGKADYKIAATITFGNFYIASLKNDGNGIMDKTDKILLFQQGSVPDVIFHYIYGNDFDSSISYCKNAAEAAGALKNGVYSDAEGNNVVPNYILVAEPTLTPVLDAKSDEIAVYANLREEYKKKSNDLDLFQASVFLKNSVSKDQGENFLASLKKDIEDAIENPDKLVEGMNKVEAPQTLFGIAPAAAKRSLGEKKNSLGLGFKLARDNKEAITNFLSIFDIKDINEEVYF